MAFINSLIHLQTVLLSQILDFLSFELSREGRLHSAFALFGFSAHVTVSPFCFAPQCLKAPSLFPCHMLSCASQVYVPVEMFPVSINGKTGLTKLERSSLAIETTVEYSPVLIVILKDGKWPFLFVLIKALKEKQTCFFNLFPVTSVNSCFCVTLERVWSMILFQVPSVKSADRLDLVDLIKVCLDGFFLFYFFILFLPCDSSHISTKDLLNDRLTIITS